MSNRTVSQLLVEEYSLTLRPGAKGECPFCHGQHFSVKRDDTLGKCFAPRCGRFLTAERPGQLPWIPAVMNQMYHAFHQELLTLDPAQRNAHAYLRERGIHARVITDAMLGVVPSGYDVRPLFQPVIDEAQAALQALQQKRGRPSKALEAAETRLAAIQEAQQKLADCLHGKAGWLVFFYSDAHHRLVALRVREPYAKRFASFKPGAAGLFGRELFSPYRSADLQWANDVMLVVEGEFNALQLQSLAVRYEEATGQQTGYVHCAAVGGVSLADTKAIKAASARPIVCYDHDESQAGFALVTALQEVMRVEACTTPEIGSDLDNYICGFGQDVRAAWQAVHALLAERKPYGRPEILIDEDIGRVVNDLVTAIQGVSGEPQLYQRAKLLSVVSHAGTAPRWMSRPPDLPAMVMAGAAHLRELAASSAKWTRVRICAKSYGFTGKKIGRHLPQYVWKKIPRFFREYCGIYGF